MGPKDAGKFVLAAVVVLAVGQAARVVPRPTSDDVGEDRIISKSMDSSSELEPHMAATSKGDLAVAWMAARGGKDGLEPTHIGARVSHDQGQTWGAIVRIDSPDHGVAEDPTVAFLRGEPHVTWLGEHGVYSARIGDAPSAVTGVETASFARPVSTSGGDRLWVAYTKVAGGNRVMLAQSSDGRTFTGAEVADGGTLPVVCAAGPVVVTAWISGTEVMVAASDDYAKTFTRFVGSSTSEHVIAEAPSCIVDGKDVWIGYGATDAATPDAPGKSPLADFVVVMHSQDAGKTTRERANVRPGAKLMHPRLVLRPSGALDVVYLTGGVDGDKNGRAAAHRVVASGAAKLPRTVHEPVIFASATEDPSWAGDYFGAASTDKVTLAALVDTRLEVSDAGGSGVERHVVIAAVPEE